MVVQRSPTPPFAKSGAIPNNMHYVYLLFSEKDLGYYIGSTGDLTARFRDHSLGRVKSTSFRRPLKFVYFEAYFDRKLALEREVKLKQFGSAYSALLKRIGRK